jgi:hypothetical protein
LGAGGRRFESSRPDFTPSPTDSIGCKCSQWRAFFALWAESVGGARLADIPTGLALAPIKRVASRYAGRYRYLLSANLISLVFQSKVPAKLRRLLTKSPTYRWAPTPQTLGGRLARLPSGLAPSSSGSQPYRAFASLFKQGSRSTRQGHSRYHIKENRSDHCVGILNRSIKVTAVGGLAMLLPLGALPQRAAASGSPRARHNWACLAHVSPIVAADPELSRLREGGRRTAMAGCGTLTGSGMRPLDDVAVSKTSCPPPEHSRLSKGTNICPNKKNQ